MTYKVGSIGEFATWTRSVVRNPSQAIGVPRKWVDSKATPALLAAEFPSNERDRRRWLRKLVGSAERRARKTGWAFDLRDEDGFLEQLWNNGRCAITGINFNLQRFPDALVKHPFAPSIDRKLSSGGYTRDNVRLVCVAVNFGLGQWGQEVYLTLARAAVEHDAKIANPSAADTEWGAGYRERIAAAQALLAALPENERAKQRRRIAGLKSVLAKGPDGLRAAAAKAKKARKTEAV
jgi:hypothetical protein